MQRSETLLISSRGFRSGVGGLPPSSSLPGRQELFSTYTNAVSKLIEYGNLCFFSTLIRFLRYLCSPSARIRRHYSITTSPQIRQTVGKNRILKGRLENALRWVHQDYSWLSKRISDAFTYFLFFRSKIQLKAKICVKFWLSRITKNVCWQVYTWFPQS